MGAATTANFCAPPATTRIAPPAARAGASRIRAACAEVRRDMFATADGNEEHARPRLRHEASRVDHHRAEAVTGADQRLADRREILAVVRGQRAIDIFEHDEAGRAALGRPDPSSSARTARRSRCESVGDRRRLPQPTVVAGERQVLAGEGSPNEIGPARQVGRRQAWRRLPQDVVPAPNWRHRSRPSPRRNHWRTRIPNPRRAQRAPFRRPRRTRRISACGTIPMIG